LQYPHHCVEYIVNVFVAMTQSYDSNNAAELGGECASEHLPCQ